MRNILFQTIKLTALFALSFGVVLYVKDNFANLFNNRVDAAGALTFNMGVNNGDPIFTFNNIVPGFTVDKTVTANNGDSIARTVGVKGVKSVQGVLDEALMIEISENGNTLYGPKKLSTFFADSQSINGIVLSQISSGDSAQYVFTVTFDTDAGNEFQNQIITFDLLFGITTDIPAACGDIKIQNIIYGTSGNDRLRGTSKNDLIIGFEGNDQIEGGSGHDCIVGGEGNNKIDGGSGHDVLSAIGGNNTIEGGSGNDQMFDGQGNSRLSGGSGNDMIFGGSGNDVLIGGAGNDMLDGEEGEDRADGGSGRDNCSAEAQRSCEQ